MTRVAIIGGGFTGLTAAREMLIKGYEVSVFESQPFWGGLSSAYPILPGVSVERFYHHLFTNDSDILGLCEELGLTEKLKTLPGKTSHYYSGKIYQFDSVFSVLRFGPLNLFERLRFGAVTLYLKLLPFPIGFEKSTAVSWLKRFYGDKSFRVVWEPLLLGKFSSYYDKISMVWFWARVKKRTSKLIYPTGGFQTIIDALVADLTKRGAKLMCNYHVNGIQKTADRKLRIESDRGAEIFDKVIITSPLPVFKRLLPALPKYFLEKLDKIEYLNAQVMILVLSRKLTPHYWVNIGDASFPFLVVGEQSNLFGTDYYKGKSVVYLGNYLLDGDRKLSMSAGDLLLYFLPFLKKLNPEFEMDWVEKCEVFSGKYAQPVVEPNYSEFIPGFKTPVEGVYLASMAQVYPWDRGINYAVKLGKDLVRQEFPEEVLK